MGDAAWTELWKTVGTALVSFFALLAAVKTGRGTIDQGNQTVEIPTPALEQTPARAGLPPAPPMQIDLTGHSPGLIEAIRTMSATISDMQERLSEQSRIIGTLQTEKADHEVIRLAFIEVVNWIDDDCPPPKPSVRMSLRRALGIATE